MKFSGKMRLTIILKVTKKQGCTVSLKKIFLEKAQGVVKLNPSSAFSGLELEYFFGILKLLIPRIPV